MRGITLADTNWHDSERGHYVISKNTELQIYLDKQVHSLPIPPYTLNRWRKMLRENPEVYCIVKLEGRLRLLERRLIQPLAI